MSQPANDNNRQELCCENRELNASCCKGTETTAAVSKLDIAWMTGLVKTPVGEIPQVLTELTLSDLVGSWKVRWGINRMNYQVSPGLYCVGEPDDLSPVLVTANYKMSFDRLRRELTGLDAWILVLNTGGINVWCAAGKGTFGTEELTKQIAAVKLAQIVSHRNIILPQLGAPGISASEVRKRSGFKVIFGPVRAADIRAFLENGLTATLEMRRVRFSLRDRIVLTPIELVGAVKISLMVFGILFVLNIFGGSFGIVDFYGYTGAVLIGCVLVPALLPWIPGKAFAWKGWLSGFLWAAAVNVINGWPDHPEYSLLRALAYLLILPAISAFLAMNFTGSSTYTSLSGVIKEMRIALPAVIISLTVGVLLLLVVSF